MHEQDDEEAFSETLLLETIENQLADNNPPAVQATLNKLTLVGYPRQESLRMMALVLAAEIGAMLAANRPFDLEGYEAALRRLPELPDEPEEN